MSFDSRLFDNRTFDIVRVAGSPVSPPSPSIGVWRPPRRIELEEFREHLYFEAYIIKRFIDKLSSTTRVVKHFMEKAGFSWQVVKPIREELTAEALTITDEFAKTLCEKYEKVEKALTEE